jgi:hypothetical protein
MLGVDRSLSRLAATASLPRVAPHGPTGCFATGCFANRKELDEAGRLIVCAPSCTDHGQLQASFSLVVGSEGAGSDGYAPTATAPRQTHLAGPPGTRCAGVCGQPMTCVIYGHD